MGWWREGCGVHGLWLKGWADTLTGVSLKIEKPEAKWYEGINATVSKEDVDVVVVDLNGL